jgi:hypothetical protein
VRLFTVIVAAFVLLGVAGVIALLLGITGGDDDGPTEEEAFRQVMATMVLQIDEVPAGMVSLGASYSTNEEAASGLGTGPTKEQLDAWGRILGHNNTFQATEPANESAITAINSSVSIYQTAQGASDSFTDRIADARAADWVTSHSDLTEFQQEELERDLGVDDMLWLHFTGFKEIGQEDRRLIADDQIVFRVDRAWGFVGIVSTAGPGVEDRGFMLQQAEALARTQVQHMRDGLKSEDLASAP